MEMSPGLTSNFNRFIDCFSIVLFFIYCFRDRKIHRKILTTLQKVMAFSMIITLTLKPAGGKNFVIIRSL